MLYLLLKNLSVSIICLELLTKSGKPMVSWKKQHYMLKTGLNNLKSKDVNAKSSKIKDMHLLFLLRSKEIYHKLCSSMDIMINNHLSLVGWKV